MTRLKLIPWLAIPALLLLFGPVLPAATAATPQASIEEADGLIYLPLDDAQIKQGATTARLQTSMTGEVAIAQYGVADAAVSNRNRFLAVRFDPPFDVPYDITKISFRSRTQLQDATKSASFRSVRLLGMNTSTGLPDKSQTLYHKRRYLGSSTGGVNEIAFSPPITVTDAGKTFFAVFDFPVPTAGIADTFPFLFTDRQFTDNGLFANSYATDTNAVVFISPALLGTVTGTALLVDQNIECSMTCMLSGDAPLNAPSNLGLNLRVTPEGPLSTWSYNNPPDPGNDLTGVELVKRDITWSTVASTGAGSERVLLESLPASGMQIWGVRSVAQGHLRSVVSNVTITGSTSVVGYTTANVEDADETNGMANEDEATSLTPPVSDRPESLWPAGDQDNYWFYAQPGQSITVTCVPFVDFRNDMEPVVNLIDHSGDVVESGVGAPGATVTVNHTVAPPAGNSSSKAFRRFIVQVMDKPGSPEGPANAWRVLIPAGYKLSVDVTTPAPFVLNEAQDGAGSVPVGSAEEFAFTNAGANPVRGHATFSFVIPRSQGEAPVKLRIYDVRGRLMSTLVNGTKTAGTHFAAWSGHDVRGNRVSPGAYFARLEAGSFSRTVRIDVLN